MTDSRQENQTPQRPEQGPTSVAEPRKQQFRKKLAETGKRFSRAGSHVVLHFFQGAEFGGRVGGTIGALVGGFLGIAGGMFAPATIPAAAKIGMVAFTGVGAAIGAIILLPMSIDEVFSELRGKQVPIVGVKSFELSTSSAFLKDVLHKTLEKNEKQPGEHISGNTVANAFSEVAARNINFADTMDLSHISAEEKHYLTEQMLPEYVASLRIMQRTGNATLHEGIKYIFSSIDDDLSKRVDAMFTENPDLVSRAVKSFRGIQGLLNCNTAAELSEFMSPGAAPRVPPPSPLAALAK